MRFVEDLEAEEVVLEISAELLPSDPSTGATEAIGDLAFGCDGIENCLPSKAMLRVRESDRRLRAVRRHVEYQSLRIAVQADIAANLIDRSDYLTTECWTETALRELLADLVEPVKVSISESPLSPLLKQAATGGLSDLAVKKLQERLAIVGDLDPVMMDGDRFIDGRHRVEAYARAGRTTIPIVDIGPLLRMDWATWMSGPL
ncbi:MAG: hypothetical protein Q7R41_19855 [Phycisphaerales bacterium]|nr:hypothetical protein [Phycisphaerales bacterium]